MTIVASVNPQKTVDHYDLDDGDDTHPIFIDYVVPAGTNGIIKVTLSWHLRAFRSTTNLSPSSIAASTPAADATGSSGHAHTIPITGAVFANAVGWDGAGQNLKGTGGGNTGNINGESGHSHSHTHGSHTHTLTGGGSQAVTDGLSSTVTNLLFDGIDKTTLLGGPWAGDVVELDVTSVFPTTGGMWHTITIDLAGLGRVVSLLRVYYTT